MSVPIRDPNIYGLAPSTFLHELAKFFIRTIALTATAAPFNVGLGRCLDSVNGKPIEAMAESVSRSLEEARRGSSQISLTLISTMREHSPLLKHPHQA